MPRFHSLDHRTHDPAAGRVFSPASAMNLFPILSVMVIAFIAVTMQADEDQSEAEI